MNPTQANHLARTGLALAAMLLLAGLFVYGAAKVMEAVGKGLGELATQVLKPMAEAMTAQQAFLTALYAGNVDAAYAFTSDRFQAAESLDQFTVYVLHHLEEAELRDISIEAVAADTCVFLVNGEDNARPVNLRVTLVRQGEQWRIDGLEWE